MPAKQNGKSLLLILVWWKKYSIDKLNFSCVQIVVINEAVIKKIIDNTSDDNVVKGFDENPIVTGSFCRATFS
jgi:hypothetical protein